MSTKRLVIPVFAALAIVCMSMTAFAEGWTQSGANWTYIDASGSRVCAEWKKGVDGKWRWLDYNGVMAVNQWVEDEYYVDAEGIMAAGEWKKISDGKAEYWYYFPSSGKKYCDGWKTIDNNSYYFDYEGHMMTGWVDDDKYYCGSDGLAKTGWQFVEDPEGSSFDDESIDGKHWYYFTSTGRRYVPVLSGESAYAVKNIDDVRYCFDGNGAMQTGWINVTGHEGDEEKITDYKYFQSNGAMARGWLSVVPPENLESNYEYSQQYFYFNSSGTPEAHKGDNDFYVQTDFKNIDGKRYLFDKNGTTLYGLMKVYTSNAKTDYEIYYLGTIKQSCVQTGKITVTDAAGASNYYFASMGRGFTGVSGGTLYYKGKAQKAESGIKYQAFLVNGSKYLVSEAGQVAKNRKKVKDADGAVWSTDSKGVVTSYDGKTSGIPYSMPEEAEIE